MSFLKFLLGRPVANREAEGRKIGVVAGVPAMGLDGLGSASYGPEAALAVLAVAGTAGLEHLTPIIWVILALLAVLFLSYWQTIAAYPNNGSSYLVARENLGEKSGLLAAAALMVDYLLNVAVGISAGVGALTSALPVLHPYTLPLCLGILAVITLVNLRGTREAGLALSVPTYLFIASLAAVLVWGLFKMMGAEGPPQPVVPPPPHPQGQEALTLWLLLRAFASGCTAMTGVEAVSNSMSAFREPRVKYAHGTLAAIVAVLGLLLLGIAHLAQGYGIMAMDQTAEGYQSVLSQLVAAVAGRNWLYYLTISSVLAVLCLSANTSFVGFPRLCHLVAQDGYLPRPFAVPGRRLVYSVGVLFLTVGAGGLLILFGGITDRLIPLFAVGAVMSFTLSQAGMAAHWWRAGKDGEAGSRGGTRLKLAINGTGALFTAAALLVILVAKFTEGAWLTAIIIPAALLLLVTVRHYYDGVDRQVLRGAERRIAVRSDPTPPAVLVPIARWDRLSRKAVEVARQLSPEVTVLHVTELAGPDEEAPDEAQSKALREEWRDAVEQPLQRAGAPLPRLRLLSSPFRSVLAPLLREVEAVQRRSPGRAIVVVLPELVEGHWWARVMHEHRERRLRAQLLRHGGAGLTVLSVPWQLVPPAPAEAMAEEEPAPEPAG
ncbi:amino acid permease [Roseomonas sp. BN140053]|uniref:amino acid permease n=1 Tax=Roseomonas sp. BN140053 TaxID=3391898 RepID=UPI0039E7A941